ncbi:hypothetical protein J6590_015260 [Homalodisca vitripennis]|nr:hypothetical protein J6590_015260 [Homalodisca vitripennis]
MNSVIEVLFYRSDGSDIAISKTRSLWQCACCLITLLRTSQDRAAVKLTNKKHVHYGSALAVLLRYLGPVKIEPQSSYCTVDKHVHYGSALAVLLRYLGPVKIEPQSRCRLHDTPFTVSKQNNKVLSYIVFVTLLMGRSH